MKRILFLIMLICTSIASLACSFLSVCIQNASILKGASSGRISVDSNNNLILYVGQQKSVLKKCNNEKDCTLWHGCGYGNEGKDYWVLYYKDGRMNVTLDDSAIKRFNTMSPSHAAHSSHISHTSHYSHYSGK